VVGARSGRGSRVLQLGWLSLGVPVEQVCWPVAETCMAREKECRKGDGLA
jgi:hypothetical protein